MPLRVQYADDWRLPPRTCGCRNEPARVVHAQRWRGCAGTPDRRPRDGPGEHRAQRALTSSARRKRVRLAAPQRRRALAELRLRTPATYAPMPPRPALSSANSADAERTSRPARCPSAISAVGREHGAIDPRQRTDDVRGARDQRPVGTVARFCAGCLSIRRRERRPARSAHPMPS